MAPIRTRGPIKPTNDALSIFKKANPLNLNINLPRDNPILKQHKKRGTVNHRPSSPGIKGKSRFHF